MATLFYDDLLFPKWISLYALKGKVSRKTRRIMLENGEEPRIALWATSLRSYDAGMVARPQEQWMTMEAFYEVTFGPTIGFLLWDPKDYHCDANQGAFAQINSTTYAFQKRYFVGRRAVYRGIPKPKEGTITIYRLNVDGSIEVVDPADYILDVQNGRLGVAPTTFTGGAVPIWTGDFYVAVRFDSDDLDWTTINRSVDPEKKLLIQASSVPLVEMRWPGMPYRLPDLFTPVDGVGGTPAPPPAPGPGPATAIVSTGPMAGTVLHASRQFSFRVNGSISTPVNVTLNGFGSSGAEGTWTPSVLTISNALDVQYATYSAATVGAKTLTRTNDGGLSNGPNLSYNAVAYPPVLTASPGYLTTAPGVASPDITVSSNAPLDVVTIITPHSNGTGGSFNPATATIGPGHPDSVTFKRIAPGTGTESITFTNNQGFMNPDPVTLNVVTAPTAITISPSTMAATTGVHSDEFTVMLDHPAAVTTHVTPQSSGSGGSFTSGAGSYEVPITSLLFNTGDQTKTFRRVAANPGTESITLTNDQGLTNPAAATLTVTGSATPPPPPPPPPAGGDGTMLTNGVLTNFGGSSGDTPRFYVDVASGQTLAQLVLADYATLAGTGDPPARFNYYLRFGTPPTTSTHDYDGVIDASTPYLAITPSPSYVGRWHLLCVLNATFPSASGAIQPALGTAAPPPPPPPPSGGTIAPNDGTYFAGTAGNSYNFDCTSTTTSTYIEFDFDLSDPGLARVYVAFNRVPTTSDYDFSQSIAANGSWRLRSNLEPSMPLTAGTWRILIVCDTTFAEMDISTEFDT